MRLISKILVLWLTDLQSNIPTVSVLLVQSWILPIALGVVEI